MATEEKKATPVTKETKATEEVEAIPRASEEAEPVVLPAPAEGEQAGEVGPLVLAGYWVRLSGDASVPEEFVGHLATVIESPWAPAPIGVLDQPIAGYTFDEDKDFTVRTRDEHNALVTDLVLESFSEISQDRVGVHA